LFLLSRGSIIMDAMNATAQPAILLDQVLRPNPPMPPRALAFVLMGVAAINFAFAAYFVSRGAWPVTPFMGADVALLAWAFRASRIAARQHERVTLTPSSLHVLRQPAKGNPTEISLNPYWVRVAMDDPPEPWSQLTLRSHGKAYSIGAFLAPTERLSFAQALKSALARARGAA
jgi:uncharacterized membrane protein